VATGVPELRLVARLHVDLLRVASACCRHARWPARPAVSGHGPGAASAVRPSGKRSASAGVLPRAVEAGRSRLGRRRRTV